MDVSVPFSGGAVPRELYAAGVTPVAWPRAGGGGLVAYPAASGSTLLPGLRFRLHLRPDPGR